MNHNIRDRDDFYEKFFTYFRQLADYKNDKSVFSTTISIMIQLLDDYINSPLSKTDDMKQFLFLLARKLDVDSRKGFSNEDMLSNISTYVDKIHSSRQAVENAPLTVDHEIKPGIQFVFVQCPILEKISTSDPSEQYSEYLDTIFPESRIRDIVYYGTHSRFDSLDNGSKDDLREIGSVGEGYYFSPNSYRYNSAHLIPVILNARRPMFNLKYNIFDFGTSIERNGRLTDMIAINRDELYRQKVNFNEPFVRRVISRIENMKEISNNDLSKIFTQVIKSLRYDSLTHYSKLLNGIEIVVFDPKQAYFLGTKQDIEGFRKFVAQQKANIRTSLTA
jgi:hypothetical protein